jgi:hypothetical protein
MSFPTSSRDFTSAFDGFPLLATRPDLGPAAHAAEVTTVFDLATPPAGHADPEESRRA